MTTDELEALLRDQLIGLHTPGAPKTRSKNAKQHVVEALGYGKQRTFTRSRPDVPGQNLSVGVQNRDNLQIWNEIPDSIPDDRRFALIRLDGSDCIAAVRVLEWATVKLWDKTGALTVKFQAARKPGKSGSVLASGLDTPRFVEALEPGPVSIEALSALSTGDRPRVGSTLPIATLYERLEGIVGVEFADERSDRLRGERLQKIVSDRLGCDRYVNPAGWPDNRCQALEIKLQTARTIDLGMVLPTSTEAALGLGANIRFCDGRFLVAYATITPKATVRIESIVLTTGVDFFVEFAQFGGNVTNSKIQLPMPSWVFEADG